MSKSAMSLKAKIRNIARQKDMSAQVVLQIYMYERFIDRLSKSTYSRNFVLKGGILIASIVGIANRSTMDMDTTVINASLNTEFLNISITDICNIELNDGVEFKMIGITSIREDDQYGGYRVSLKANYDSMITSMQIDITTADVITPKERLFNYKQLFKDAYIEVLSYNLETILAEKIETILTRGEFNTRPRDFYDVYILTKTQNIDKKIFIEALKQTSIHRKSLKNKEEINKTIDTIEKDEKLKSNWLKYTTQYRYASNINYQQLIDSLRNLLEI